MNFSNEIYNEAIDLSLDWGESWLKPIAGKLQEIYPQLHERDIADLENECKKTQDFAFYNFKQARDGRITEKEAEERIRDQFPKLSESNLERLISHYKFYGGEFRKK